MGTRSFEGVLLSTLMVASLASAVSALSFPVLNVGGNVKLGSNWGTTPSENVALYWDNFDAYDTGTFPPGWGKVYSGRDWSYCRTTNDQSYSSPNSWRLESKIGWSQVVGRRLPGPPNLSSVYDYSNGLSADEYAETVEWLKSHPQIWFEARVKIDDIPPKPWWVDWGLGCVTFYKVFPLWGRSYGGVGFGVDKDTEEPIIGSGGETMPLELQRWYHIRVCTDLAKRTFCSWVDGKPLAVNAPVDNEGFPEMLKLDIGNIGDYTVGWFDDIKIGYVSGVPPVVGRETTSLSISEESFTLQADESKILTATLTSDGNPVKGENITWSATAGTITPSGGKTDTAGQVSVVYTAPSYEAYIIVSASYAGSEQYELSSVNSYGTITEPSTGVSTGFIIGIGLGIGFALIGVAIILARRQAMATRS